MKIEMMVKYPYMLKEYWNGWIDAEDEIKMEIFEEGLSATNEPVIWKNDGEYKYMTSSWKGEYYFQYNRSTLIFEGYRNSFGNTNYFDISNDLNGETRDLLLYSRGSNVAISLYVTKFETSAPEQEFWAAGKKITKLSD